LGDFNIDLLKTTESNPKYANFLDIMRSHLLLPSILLPTRITANSKTSIDNIFVSASHHESVAGNIVCNISDHFPQFILINHAKKNPSSHTPLFKPKWSSFNKENFILDYLDIEWNKTLQTVIGDANASFNVFYSHMSNLMDRHVPLVKLTKKQIKTNCKPWITTGIIKSINKRDILLKQYIKSKIPSKKTLLYNQYKKYRNLLVSLCKRSKSNYYSTYFQSNLGNIKKIWQGVNNLISSKGNSQPPPISLSIDGITTSDPKTVSNTFNNYFCNIAYSITSKIPPTSKHFSEFLKTPSCNSFFLYPTSPQEVENHINSLSNRKASGLYSFPINILKLLKTDISIPIASIINVSFATGCFPSSLKLSKIIPVLKKGSPIEVSNYRPILFYLILKK
jgi:hypothetical protein